MKSYQKIAKSIKCPVCGDNNAHVLWSVNSHQAAQNYVLYEKEPDRFLQLVAHIEVLWGRNDCEVVQCDHCSFCYSHPYVAGDMDFYTLAYERSGYPTWKWEFQQTYNALKTSAESDHTLLELGAGNGAFVKRIIADILAKENVTCMEFSEYGRHQLEKMGVKCFSQDIRELQSAELEESFDVICMFHVLEHMDNLDVLFQKLNWLMKKEASLFIAVPNEKRIEFNELNGALLDMPPNHIGRWNKRSFEEIARKYAFHINEYKIEKSGFSLLMLRQFITYRFLRNSQQKGRFENYIMRIKNRNLMRLFQIFGLLINAIISIPVLTKTGFREGNSQWVHFTKVK